VIVLILYVSDVHFTPYHIILNTHIQVLQRRKVNPKNLMF